MTQDVEWPHMMFSREDFRIDSFGELLEFIPVALLLGLVGPFLLAAYGVGFVMKVTGWLQTDS